MSLVTLMNGEGTQHAEGILNAESEKGIQKWASALNIVMTEHINKLGEKMVKNVGNGEVNSKNLDLVLNNVFNARELYTYIQRSTKFLMDNLPFVIVSAGVDLQDKINAYFSSNFTLFKNLLKLIIAIFNMSFSVVFS